MRLFVLSIAILISTPSWAQFTVEGIVLNSEDSSAIPGVLVYQDSLNKTTTTIDGKFYLTLAEKPDSLENNLEFQARSLEAALRSIYIPVDVILGYSSLKYSDEELSDVSNAGLLFGLARYFGQLDLSATGKVVIYEDIVDYKAEISKKFYWRINTFIRIHHLKSYSELTLGVGYKFLYVFDDLNKY